MIKIKNNWFFFLIIKIDCNTNTNKNIYFLTVFWQFSISINIWFSNSLYFLFSFLISTHFVSFVAHYIYLLNFSFIFFIVFYMSLYVLISAILVFIQAIFFFDVNNFLEKYSTDVMQFISSWEKKFSWKIAHFS